MYVQEPVLEGFFDDLKAAALRLKKVKPLQVIAREAGVDPAGTLSVKPQAGGWSGFATGDTGQGVGLLALAALAFILMRKK